MTTYDIVTLEMATGAVIISLGSAALAAGARRAARASERAAANAAMVRDLALGMPAPGEELPSITCPMCGRTSYHPEDVRQGYCGACHQYVLRPEQAGPAPI